MSEYLFTSESVSEGHPDKLCDQVSDGILDAIIAVDPNCRVACETATKTGFIMLAGEITTEAVIEYPTIVREVVKEIGYDSSSCGFDYETCGVLVAVERQSPDIAQGVDGKGVYTKDDLGAGDQGMMFGYACNETPELMPSPIQYAHKLTKKMADLRKKGKLDFLRPDSKSQVTIRYDENHKPLAVENVVVSSQHDPEVKHKQLREAIIEEVVKPSIPARLLSRKTKFYINPTGRFVVGGPMGDSGLTGRKIIVDTYGGMGRHGGGAFSGKDPSKVDRSAAYYARYIAKNIVAAGLASRCEVQLAYAIGVAKPVSLLVETFGTGTIPDAKISKLVSAHFDARPSALIEELDLLRPIYRQTAAYGHFGRKSKRGQNGFTWEQTDKAEALMDAASGPSAAKKASKKAAKKASKKAAKKASKKAAKKASKKAAKKA